MYLMYLNLKMTDLHVQTEKYDTVYVVDINEEYLNAVKERYGDLKGVLECIHLDLINETEKLPPAELVIGEREAEGVRVRVRITEGKFHQVKRMFEAVGCQVLTLKRIRMGDLDLPEDLRTGDARPMREEELALLQMQGAADQ